MKTLMILIFSITLLLPAAHAQAFNVNALAPAIVQVRTPSGAGSGSLIVEGDQVLLLTNRHVVNGEDDVTVAVLVDINEPAVPLFKAELRAFSGTYDVALYQLTSDLDGRPVSAQALLSGEHPSGYVLPLLEMAPADQIMSRGDTIALLGYPGLADNDLVYTTGIISSVQMQDLDGDRVAGWYRTTAEMSPGNSGGVALDNRGRVVGIPTAVHTEQRTGGRLGSLLAMPLAMHVLGSDDLLTDWNDDVSTDRWLATDQSGRFGEHSIGGNSFGEPFHSVIVAGGSNDITNLGDDCVGYVAAQPDFLLTVTDRSEPVSLRFTAEDSGDDAVLVIHDPAGRWLCNDDTEPGSLDPALRIHPTSPGDYRIWVGSYQSGALFNGVLSIGTADAVQISSTREQVGLDWQGMPYFGEVTLERLFLPDPHTVTVLSGGPVNLQEGSYASGCVGYASHRPDVRLFWNGSTEDLRVYFVPDTAGDDATLIVNTSSGHWICNDDAHDRTLNPALPLNGAGPGQFDIWVGSYNSDATISGTLYITELSDSVP
ncbi:MAG: serine protease [Halomonas sp.]|uniref:S1 family peptidase n=1 Tax=Halomonas sp. TaxID=1486246 RepID=UPI003970C046